MKVSDIKITPNKGSVYIKSKGDKDRTVPLCKELRNVLTPLFGITQGQPVPIRVPVSAVGTVYHHAGNSAHD